MTYLCVLGISTTPFIPGGVFIKAFKIEMHSETQGIAIGLVRTYEKEEVEEKREREREKGRGRGREG